MARRAPEVTMQRTRFPFRAQLRDLGEITGHFRIPGDPAALADRVLAAPSPEAALVLEVAGMVTDWDLEDGGRTVPLTEESLGRVPCFALAAVRRAIVDTLRTEGLIRSVN